MLEQPPIIPPPIAPVPLKPIVWHSFVAFVIAFMGMSMASVVVIGGAIALMLARGEAPRGVELNEMMRNVVMVPWVLTTSVAISSIGLALTALIGARLSKQPVESRLRVGPAGIPVAHTVLLLLAVLSVGQVSSWLASLTGAYESSILANIARAAREMPLPWFVALLVFGCLGAGFGEELFFRGFMQTQLRERWGKWAAIAITAGFFGALHADPVHTPLAFLMGLMLGWGAELRGNIRPVIVVHALNNLISFLLSRYVPESDDPQWPWTIAALLIGLAAVAALKVINRTPAVA